MSLNEREDHLDFLAIINALNSSDETEGIKRLARSLLRACIRLLYAYPERTDRSDILKEFALIAKIRIHSSESKLLTRRALILLTSRDKWSKPALFTDKQATTEALYTFLEFCDPGSIEALDLYELVKYMLAELDPSRTPYTSETFVLQELRLMTLHRIFVHISVIDPEGLKSNTYCEEVMKSLQEIKRNVQTSYPLYFQASLAELTIKRVNQDDASSSAADSNKTAPVVARLLEFFAKVVFEKINVQQVKDEMRILVGAKPDSNKVAESWYEVYLVLATATVSVRQCPAKIALFKEAWSAAEHLCGSADREGNESLIYGMISQLRAATTSEVSVLADYALEKLISLASVPLSPLAWFSKGHLLQEILRSLTATAKKLKAQTRIVPVVYDLITICKETPALQKVIEDWLGNDTVENKLSVDEDSETTEDLYQMVAKVTGLKLEDDGVTARRELKTKYKAKDFGEVICGLNREAKTHVDQFNHTLLVQTNPAIQPQQSVEEITSKDLLERIVVWKNKVKQFFIIGQPGTGKTCVAKILANSWAKDECNQFQYVFILSSFSKEFKRKRSGDTDSKLGSIEEVIVERCFLKKDELRSQGLCTQIKAALQRDDTLLVLDDSEVLENSFHLDDVTKCVRLSLNRPDVQPTDQEQCFTMKCIGLSPFQLNAYIGTQNISGNEDQRQMLQSFLKRCPILQEIASVSFNAQLIVPLWNTEEDCACKCPYKFLSSLMLKWVDRHNDECHDKSWEICLEKHFNMLGQISLEEFEAEGTKVKHDSVEKHAKEGAARRLLSDIGFLLPSNEKNSHYFFPFLAYRHYFAGIYLGRLLRRSDQDHVAKRHLEKLRWTAPCETVVAVAVREACELESVNTVSKLLKNKDEPHPMCRISDLFSKLKILDLALGCSNAVDVEDILTNKDDVSELLEEIEEKLEELSHDCHVLEWLAQKFACLLHIQRTSSWLFESLMDRVLNENAVEMIPKLPLLAVVVRHVPEEFQEIVKKIQTLLETEAGDNRLLMLQHVAAIVKIAPNETVSIVKQVFSCLDDDNSAAVRETAMKQIGQIVHIRPEAASIAFEAASRAFTDEDHSIKRSGIRLWAHIAEAVPENDEASDALERIKQCLEEEEEFVKVEATTQLFHLLSTSPDLVKNCIQPVEEANEPEAGDVVHAILNQIASVVRATTVDKGKQLLDLARIACDSGNEALHIAALQQMNGIFAVIPSDELLSLLNNACSNESEQVKAEAITQKITLLNVLTQRDEEIKSLLEESELNGSERVRCCCLNKMPDFINSNPKLFDSLFVRLLDANTQSGDVKNTAFESLKKISSKALIDRYWNTHDEAIPRALAAKLLHLTIFKRAAKRRSTAKLVVYEVAYPKPFEWERGESGIEELLNLIEEHVLEQCHPSTNDEANVS